MATEHDPDSTTPEYGFYCEAYGSDGGDLCFLEGVRPHCQDEQVCSTLLYFERRALYARIVERAELGDETAEYLASEILGPDELLGGPDADRQRRPG